MLRFVRRTSLLFLFLPPFLSSFAQQELPNTLLWRISGNGLSKPSYLWGTLHLQDKRLFYFGDSLYRALETTDGYAMEVSPNEFMDSVLTGAMRAEEDKLVEGKRVTLNRKKLSKSADSLLRSAGIKGNVATKKDLKKIRDRRMMKILQGGEMPTIMDAYLLGLARRLNKWTGGIEDVNDQLRLSDELGGELEPEAVLQPEEAYRYSIEAMTKLYLSQDLMAIDRFSNGAYSAKAKDAVLIHRNLKMAFRMDSLAHVRPMFFTVGAAHLPGDSGVISELQHRGFRVEPVVSSATRFAGDYAAGLPAAKWDTVRGDANVYTALMPGQAADYNAFGSLLKMKLHFDMTTMTFYLTGSVANTGVDVERLNRMLTDMVHNMTGGKAPVKTKGVDGASFAGKEAEAQNEYAAYRVRLLLQNKTVFMLMAGTVKKKAVNGPDVERFFASFVPQAPVVESHQWTALALPQKGASVKAPVALLRNEAIDRKLAASGSWQGESYNGVDPLTGSYYLFQVREPASEFFLDGDSAYFEQIKKDYRQAMDSVLRVQPSTVQSCPALYVDAYMTKANAVYKTLAVTRGNRVYMLIAGVPKDSSTADAESFLSSLTLLPYEASKASTQSVDGFSAVVPGPLKKGDSDTAAQRRQRMTYYFTSDEKTAATYYVYKTVFSPNYWIGSDSAFFNGRAMLVKGENDSIIKKEWVRSGNTKGLEFLLQSPGYNGLKKRRLFINGDTLYTLYSIVPRQDTANETEAAFFNGFRILHEVAPTIYTKKAAALLYNLQSPDSATSADAASYLDAVSFDKEDLPLLHEALLKPYRDSDAYETAAGDKLGRIAGKLADSTTVAFIRKHYHAAAPGYAPAQYRLLTVLAKAKSPSAYAVLKELLLSEPPTAGEAYRLRYALFDSLALSATLFPALLQKSNDSLLGYTLISVANRLLDSSWLARNALTAYEEPIVEGAGRAERQLRNSEDESWTFAGWSEMLGHLNTAAGNAVLRRALATKDLYIKQSVITALLKNNQPVPPAAILKVAADKSQRSDFYSELKKLGKEGLFPTLYASQKSLAESELSNYFSDDYGDYSLTYLAAKTEAFNGKPRRFYLFRVRMAYNDEDRRQNFLAVAGPYEVNAKDKSTTGDASGFYSEEELTATNLNKLFKSYLQQSSAVEKQ